MKFFSFSPIFPVDYNSSMKIIMFSSVNEWLVIGFASPHRITNVGYVKNTYLQRLVVEPLV